MENFESNESMGFSPSTGGDPILKEADRKKLDGIVKKMVSNGESDANIKFVVKDFKSKYGIKSKGVSTGQNTASQSASENGGFSSGSSEVRPQSKSGNGLIEKPKTILQKMQEGEMSRPKVGEEVKTINRQDVVAEKKIEKLQPKLEKTNNRIKEKVSKNYYNNTNVGSRWTDVTLPTNDEVIKANNAFGRLSAKNPEFVRYLKNETDYFQREPNYREGDALRKEYEMNDYMQGYVENQSNFIKNKMKLAKTPEEQQSLIIQYQDLNNKYEQFKNSLTNLNKKEEEIKNRNENLHKRAKSGQGNALYQIGKTVGSFAEGAYRPIEDILQAGIENLDEGLGKIGAGKLLDEGVRRGRFARTIRDVENQDGFDTAFGTGKKVKYGKDTYIVTSNGNIVDEDTGSSINSFTDRDTLQQILNKAETSKEQGSFFSGVSLTKQVVGTAGQIISQVAMSRGIGGSAATAGSFAKNGAIVNATLLSTSAYNETVSELLKAGVSESDARASAAELSVYMAGVGALTGALSPNSESAALVGQKFKNDVVKKAVTAYLDKGVSGIKGFIKNTVKELPNVLKETGLENVQEYVETGAQKRLNADINRDLGRNILDENFTQDEMMNIALVASLSSGTTSGVGAVSKGVSGMFGMDMKTQFDAVSEMNDDDFVKSLKTVVNQGAISPERASEMVNEVRNYRNYKNKLAEGVTGRKAVNATQLMAERDDLKRQKKNLDEAFHPELDAKIEEVNNKISKVLNGKDEEATTSTETGLEENTTRPEGEGDQGETSVSQTVGTGKSTQEFFGNVVKGGDERYEPSKKYEYEQDFTEEQDKFSGNESNQTKEQSSEETGGNKEGENTSKSENVRNYVDSPARFKNQKGEVVEGVIKQDGQRVVVETDKEIYDIGNIDEVGDKSLEEMNLTVNDPVTLSEYGKVQVRGKSYTNNFSDPKQAINRDSDGKIISVNLETEDGQKRTFRGQMAEDIAYQIHATEFTKSVDEEVDIDNPDVFDKFIKGVDDLIDAIDRHTKGTLGIGIAPVVAKGALKAVRATAVTTRNTVKAINAGIEYMKSTDWYKGLTQEQKKELESKTNGEIFDELLKSVKKPEQSMAEKRVETVTIDDKKSTKSVVRENTGQTDKSKKITMTEAKALKDKFKNLQRGFKQGVKDTQQLKRDFVNDVKAAIKGLGNHITETDAKTMLNQVANVNEKNIDKVSKIIDNLSDRLEERKMKSEFAQVKGKLKKNSKSGSKLQPTNIKETAKQALTINEKYLSSEQQLEFKNIINEINDSFSSVTSDKYKMMDVEKVSEKLDKLKEISDNNQLKELADKLGVDSSIIPKDELLKLWKSENADEFAKNLSDAKKKEVRDKLQKQSEYSKIGLKELDFGKLDDVQKKLLKNLLNSDLSKLDLEGLKQFIKFSDNIIINGDFSNVGKLSAKIESFKNVESLMNFINKDKINVEKVSTDKRGIKGIAKSIFDAITDISLTLNQIMGSSKNGSMAYNYLNFFDLSNANMRANKRGEKFLDNYNNLIKDLKKNTFDSITHGESVIKRSIFSTLLQADYSSPESMKRFKDGYIQHSIDMLRKYTNDSQSLSIANICEKTLNDLKDINTKEELIDYLKNNESKNYKIIRFVSGKDGFLGLTKEFSDNSYYNHGVIFEPRKEEDYYVPLISSNIVKPKLLKGNIEDAKKSGDLEGIVAPSSKSGSIFSRNTNVRLKEGETINFDFDSFVSQKYKEQLYDIEATNEILKTKSILTNPEFLDKFGSSANLLNQKAFNKIVLDSGRNIYKHSDIEKSILKAERFAGKLASVQALGGFLQYPKQYASVAIGASIRLAENAPLLLKYMMMDKAGTELLKMSSIAMRGESEGGTKRLSDNIKKDVLTTNKYNNIIKDISSMTGMKIEKAREFFMMSLRKGDVNIANTTFLAYYHDFLLRKGVKNSEIDINKEHEKINEGDQLRKEALAYAQHMVNTTQLTSDLSEGSDLLTNQSVAFKLLSRVVIPFSSFSNHSMVRLAKASGGILTGENKVENFKEATASVSEIIAFQSIKALVIAPMLMVASKAIFQDDDETQKKTTDWAFQMNKVVSGSLQDFSPLPDSFDTDFINYIMYLKNKDNYKADSFEDFAHKVKQDKSEDKPWTMYKYGDEEGWDFLKGGVKGAGLYQVFIDQNKKTLESFDALMDNEITQKNKYGQTEQYHFDEKYRNFLIMNAISNTMSSVGVFDADVKRFIESRYRDVKKDSKTHSSGNSSGSSSFGGFGSEFNKGFGGFGK